MQRDRLRAEGSRLAARQDDGVEPPPESADLRIFFRIVFALLVAALVGVCLAYLFVPRIMTTGGDIEMSDSHTLVPRPPRARNIHDVPEDVLRLPKLAILHSRNPVGPNDLEEVPIHSKSKNELQLLCKQYHLSGSGNKADLRDRLREYSQQPMLWKTSHPSKPHLGPRKGAFASAKESSKQSARRRAELEKNGAMLSTAAAGIPVLAPPQVAASSNPEQISQEAQEEAAQADDRDRRAVIFAWVLAVREFRRNQEAHRRAAREKPPVMPKPPPVVPLNAVSRELQQLTNSASTGLAHPVYYRTYAENSPASSTPSLTAFDNSLFESAPPSTPSATASLSATTASEPNNTRTIVLKRSGVVVDFNIHDVPPPPFLSFASADKLEIINRMWDENQAFGSPVKSPVVVKGVSIPIKYWKTVFSSKGSHAWKVGYWSSVKGKYFNAKKLVHAMRRTTKVEDFWAMFSVNGKKMNFKEIQARLAAMRRDEDNRLMAQAKQEYGADFGKIFGYHKQGKWHVKSNPADIAKQYRLMNRRKAKDETVCHSDSEQDTEDEGMEDTAA